MFQGYSPNSATDSIPQPTNPVLKGLQWAAFSPTLQHQLAYAADSQPGLTDVDVNHIILQDPSSTMEAQSSPGGYNAGQLAAVLNARGKSLGASRPFGRMAPSEPLE